MHLVGILETAASTTFSMPLRNFVTAVGGKRTGSHGVKGGAFQRRLDLAPAESSASRRELQSAHRIDAVGSEAQLRPPGLAQSGTTRLSARELAMAHAARVLERRHDNMSPGKTVQTLAALSARGSNGAALVVVPASVLYT